VNETVTVVGAGSIGVAWALLFARGGHEVRLFDPDDERRGAAPVELRARLDSLAAAGMLGPEDPPEIAGRVLVSGDLEATVGGADYVQECAPEDLTLKRHLFAELDAMAPAHALLASSSSALPCSAFTASLPGARRCLIAHPANPPYLLPIVELVPSPATDDATIRTASLLLRSAGLTPIRLSREIEGFVFNRLQGAVLREAYCLVRDGIVAPEDVDLVMRNGLGRRWSILGPFETAELNTRGGIEAHARLLGPAYARMGAERGQADEWDDALVARVSRAVQRRFPRARWAEHVAWRDRALMILDRCRREHTELSGPPGAPGDDNEWRQR
jgi:L-gulonate 3-dehydrogenase